MGCGCGSGCCCGGGGGNMAPRPSPRTRCDYLSTPLVVGGDGPWRAMGDDRRVGGLMGGGGGGWSHAVQVLLRTSTRCSPGTRVRTFRNRLTLALAPRPSPSTMFYPTLPVHPAHHLAHSRPPSLQPARIHASSLPRSLADNLLDEQALAGDPRAKKSAGTPVTMWDPGYTQW